MKKRILFLDSNHPVMIETLRANGFVCEEDYTSSKEEVMQKLHGYHGVVIRSRFKLDKVFLDAGTQLRCIGRAGAGMENIDVEYATSKGITCVHAPEGNRVAVGEHALGMLLSLMNNFRKSDNETRNGIWKREENRGTELTGKTVGIIGYGNMGSSFAKVLAGFDVKVLAYDKFKSGFSNGYVQEASLENIFENADVLSLHVPLTEETNMMVNDAFLNAFTKPIWFINTSRGKVVQTSAVVNALENGKIKGAAIDVLEYESVSFEQLDADELPEPFQRLRRMDNVIITPHVAGWTFESHLKIGKVIADKMSAVLSA
ncbi:MAG: 2-hydroxyacid dehydrogenase [Bacteroidia bacterium]|nr:2-hydroxyacid dehydrogenase [Bacteroidia bacterium]